MKLEDSQLHLPSFSAKRQGLASGSACFPSQHSYRHLVTTQPFPTPKNTLAALPALLPWLLAPQIPSRSPQLSAGSILHLPYLPNHGFGQHFCSPRAAQHVSRLQEDLGSVLDRFQVPFLPRCQGSVNGFVNELLRKKRGKAARRNPPPLRHQVRGEGEWPSIPGRKPRQPFSHCNPKFAAPSTDLFQDPWHLESQHPPLQPPCSQSEQRFAFHPDFSPAISKRITLQASQPRYEIRLAKPRRNAAAYPPAKTKRGRAIRCAHLVGIAVLGHLVRMIKWLKREEKPP